MNRIQEETVRNREEMGHQQGEHSHGAQGSAFTSYSGTLCFLCASDRSQVFCCFIYFFFLLVVKSPPTDVGDTKDMSSIPGVRGGTHSSILD